MTSNVTLTVDCSDEGKLYYIDTTRGNYILKIPPFCQAVTDKNLLPPYYSGKTVVDNLQSQFTMPKFKDILSDEDGLILHQYQELKFKGLDPKLQLEINEWHKNIEELEQQVKQLKEFDWSQQFSPFECYKNCNNKFNNNCNCNHSILHDQLNLPLK